MKTKDRILDVARQMIAEVGYHSTTTAALAKRAGISEGTIYRHFESKEDVLLHILTQLDDKYMVFIQGLRSRDDGSPGTIERVVRHHFRFVADNVEGIKIVLSSYGLLSPSKQSMTSVIERMRNFFTECLEKADKMGVTRKDLDVEHTSMTLVAMLLGLMQLKLYWPEMEKLDAEAMEFTRRSLVKDA